MRDVRDQRHSPALAAASASKILIRPMAPHDYVAVCKMTDRNRARVPLTAREVRNLCRQQWVVASVAEPYTGDVDGRASYQPIVGFMFHAVFPDHFEFFDLMIDRPHRRRGIGTLMARQVTNRLCPGRRLRAIADVPETNLPAQLFLRSLGFRCVKTIDNRPMPDVYRFSLRVESGT